MPNIKETPQEKWARFDKEFQLRQIYLKKRYKTHSFDNNKQKEEYQEVKSTQELNNLPITIISLEKYNEEDQLSHKPNNEDIKHNLIKNETTHSEEEKKHSRPLNILKMLISAITIIIIMSIPFLLFINEIIHDCEKFNTIYTSPDCKHNINIRK